MARIAEKLFLGGKKEAKDLDFLERNSISHILNCTPSRGEDPTAGVPNYHQQDARFTYDAARPVWHRGCRCRGSSGSGGSGGSGAGSRLQAMHADDAEALGQPRRPRQAAAVNDGSHNLGHGVRDVADDLPTRQRPNGRDYTPHPLRKQRRGDIVHAHDHLQQQHAEVVQVSGHDGGVALTDTDARRRCGHVQPPLRRSDGVGHKHADIGCAYGGSSNDATAVASIAPYTRVVAAYARTNRDHVTVAGRSRGGINTSS
jgi:hypothetical protein